MADLNISIRRARKEDAALIADLSRKTFYESFVSWNTEENMKKFMENEFSREKLIAEAEADDGIFLLAHVSDQPAGYARLRNTENPEALQGSPHIEIARIYAVTNAIGKGVGSALMQACIDLAIDNKCQWIWLGVWEHNLRALAFYNKWGFEKFGSHIFMVGEDPQTDWLLRKQL